MKDYENRLPRYMSGVCLILFVVVMFQACDDHAIKEIKHINFTNPEQRYGELVDRYDLPTRLAMDRQSLITIKPFIMKSCVVVRFGT